MSLKAKLALTFSATIFVFIVAFYAFSFHVWSQSFVGLEDKSYTEAGDGAERIVSDYVDRFSEKVRGWKNFGAADNPHFMAVVKADYVLKFDMNGQLISATGYKTEVASESSKPEKTEVSKLWINKATKFILARLRTGDKGISASGFIFDEQNPVATVVTPTENQFVVFGRVIDEPEKQSINKLINRTLRFSSNSKELSAESIRKTAFIENNKATVSRALLDLDMHVAGIIEFDTDREINSTGKSTLNSFMMTVIIMCIAFSSFVYFMVKRNTIDLLTDFSHQVSAIESFDKASHIKSNDEGDFQSLATNINKMLDRLRDDAVKMQGQEASLVQAAKMASLGEMAGGIAHEINNPLAIINGNAQILKRLLAVTPIDAKDAQERVTKITETAFRISKIIKGLRSFSRDASQDPFQPNSVKNIIDDLVGLCGERCKKLNIKLSVPEFADDSLKIDCRPAQIIQVLLNLVSNALDELEGREDAWVTLSVAEDDTFVSFRVTDSGNGIPKDVREKMFQPFYTTKGVGNGTGLGLSISVGIAKSHNGTLTYDEASKNTCFLLKVPKKQAGQAPVSAPQAA